jgi:hypothetical protein
MKRILLSFLLTGIVGTGVLYAGNGNCPNCPKDKPHKKVSQTKGYQKPKAGAKHGFYDVTHNKVTKHTKINEGNQKYSKRNDIDVKD